MSAAEKATASEVAAEPRAAPAVSRWMLLGMTLLLVGLAAFQLVYVVPRCLYVVQQFAGHWVPAPLRLLAAVPEWSSVTAALAAGALAVWQRRSLHRVTLLATVALAF